MIYMKYFKLQTLLIALIIWCDPFNVRVTFIKCLVQITHAIRKLRGKVTPMKKTLWRNHFGCN